MEHNIHSYDSRRKLYHASWCAQACECSSVSQHSRLTHLMQVSQWLNYKLPLSCMQLPQEDQLQNLNTDKKVSIPTEWISAGKRKEVGLHFSTIMLMQSLLRVIYVFAIKSQITYEDPYQGALRQVRTICGLPSPHFAKSSLVVPPSKY